MLRDFRKTAVLAPGAAETVRFSLTSQGLSTWREQGIRGGFWHRAEGEFTALVGSSSRDERLSHAFAG